MQDGEPDPAAEPVERGEEGDAAVGERLQRQAVAVRAGQPHLGEGHRPAGAVLHRHRQHAPGVDERDARGLLALQVLADIIGIELGVEQIVMVAGGEHARAGLAVGISPPFGDRRRRRGRDGLVGGDAGDGRSRIRARASAPGCR